MTYEEFIIHYYAFLQLQLRRQRGTSISEVCLYVEHLKFTRPPLPSILQGVKNTSILSNDDRDLFDTETARIRSPFLQRDQIFRNLLIFEFKGHPFQNEATHLKYET